MKKRTAMIFSAGLFLIALAFFFVFMYNDSGKKEGGIVLPQGSMQTEEAVDIAKRNARKIEEITVTAENVQNVVKTLERPGEYYMSAGITFYYEGGRTDYTNSVRCKDSFARILVSKSGGKREKELLITDSNVYIWGDSPINYYKGTKGLGTTENEAYMPTYETVLQLPATDIITADTRMHDGRLCVFLITSYKEGSYTREWYIDIDSGLLLACETKENGAVIYSMTRTELRISSQDDSFFALPLA